MGEGGSIGTPGSAEAREQGCNCPVLDNHRGRGIEIDGRRMFFYREDCPVHGPGCCDEQPRCICTEADDPNDHRRDCPQWRRS